MSGMTRDRLEELRRIAEQATPGPWEWNKYLNLFSATGKPVLTKPFSPDNPDVVEAMPEDLDYIERFNPETVLALLDEIERLRRELDVERGGGGSESHTTRYLLHSSEYGTWECEADDCDVLWYLEDGTPSENRMRYCPGCGRRIVAEVWDMEEQEAEEESA